MSAKSQLVTTPPYAVESSIKRLGSDLRYARLRRNLTIAEVAEKIGTGLRAVRDAEHGKPTTSMSIYAALMWTYDLLGQLNDVATPEGDAVGQAMARINGREKSRAATKELDDDF